MRISIVIPVYNGLGNYLDDALNSIWSQELNESEYEVICVDDCSTDGTYKYLQQTQKEHSNLIVLQTEKNLRQGGARNMGLHAANGQYIMFLDQDDYYSKGSISKVMSHLDSAIELDVLVCDSAWQIRGRENFQLQHNLKFAHIMGGDQFIVDNGIPFAPWKYVIRKEFIINNSLYFQPDNRIEDVDWSLKTVHCAKKIQYAPILLVHYNRGAGSTTWDSYKDFNTIIDTIKMSKRVFDLRDTIFINSNQKTKFCVEAIAMSGYLYGAKMLLGIPGAINKKTVCLKDNISVLKDNNTKSKSIIARVVGLSPFLYAMVTALLFPIYLCALSIHRKIKFS